MNMRSLSMILASTMLLSNMTYANVINPNKISEIKELQAEAFASNTYTSRRKPAVKNSASVMSSTAMQEKGYTGEGTLIAIIDTGLETTHEAFNTYMPSSPKLKKEDVAAIIEKGGLSAKGITVDDVYINDKMPFVFDYADNDSDVTPNENTGFHGTHVTGIAAGNCDNLKGVAPNAQIIMMKVFSDETGMGGDDELIMQAINDAIALGADVINISLGGTSGYSTLTDSKFIEVYEKARKAGISISAAIGNDNHASDYGLAHELPKTENPDYGLVSDPASFTVPVAVAGAFNPVRRQVPYFMVGDKKFDFSNGASYEEDPNIAEFRGTYELVDCGSGSVENVKAAGDIKGKVAIITRDHIEESEAINNVAAAGAVAVIGCNMVDSIWNIMGADVINIPACGVSKIDGAKIRELAKQGKKVTFNPEYKEDMNNENIDIALAEYSAWGCTPDLKLKPEITAPSSDIYSSTLDNDYVRASGTSLAAPHIAGLYAQAREYINKNYPQIPYTEQSLFVDRLMMSTAKQFKDSNGVYISPRKQGAGLADIERMFAAKGYLEAKTSFTTPDRPKAELGDSATGEYEIEVTITNITDEEVTYKPSASALVDKAENGYVTLYSEECLGKGINVSFDKKEIKVAPKSTATVKVKMTLTDEFKKQLDKTFANGTFVEGFLFFEDMTGGTNLSMPYMGFYGDWAKAPIFDKPVYEDYDIFGTYAYSVVEPSTDETAEAEEEVMPAEYIWTKSS